jgi:hypothetical protein
MVRRSTLLDVASGTEELLRRIEGTGVDTTGHDPAGCRRSQVVGRDRRVMPSSMITTSSPRSDHALGALDRYLGEVGVLVAGPVKGEPHVPTVLQPASHGR